MEQHAHALNVECPQCHHVFDVEASLSTQIERRLKADLAKDQQQALNELVAERKKLADQAHDLSLKQATIQQQVDLRVKQEREEIKAQALKEAQQTNLEEHQALMKKAAEQGTELSKLKKEQLDLLNEKEKLVQAKADIELEAKKTVDKERKRIEEEVKQREAEADRMKDREKDLVMEKLKEQVEDMKRKMEQGSMQVQGEVQELELRELLEDLFRNDLIEEVATGANGADVLHVVHDRIGRPCGTIAYESKRTKAFGEKWIEKLKEDMQRHKAEIGVIVTESMPKDMPTMGMRNGVFVCSFSEVRGLALVLRQSVLRIAEVRSQEENKDDKAHLLYAYFTSPEFKRRMQVIVDGYAVMKQQLDTEKRLVQKQWAARDKQLEALVSSATELQGSILGIAGATMEAIAGEHDAAELN
ncbi:MAG: DUF2130 domain-containing protein [Flavobacteriales bacterium]|nr:DUF2130 domain-containing protein [Flavobacteriales bacterium]